MKTETAAEPANSSMSTIRVLGFVMFSQAFGFGLLITLSVIYFTRFGGVSVTQIGIGLTIAGIFGLLSGVPVGSLSDKIGPKLLLIQILALESVCVFLYLIVESFTTFLLAACIYQIIDRAGMAVRGGLIAKALPAESQVKGRSILRSINNAGSALGSIAGVFALEADTADSFQLMIAIAGLGYLLSAIFAMLIPAIGPMDKKRHIPIFHVIRDRRFMAFSILNSVLSIQYSVIEIGMPLWIISHTDAPKWMVTALLVGNTLFVVGSQVPVGNHADKVLGSRRATVASSILLAASCISFGVSGYALHYASIGLLALAGILHVFGEMYQTAASWSLAYTLAPPDAHGQYQGMFSVSTSAGLMIGSLVLALVVQAGFVGWLLLGCTFLIAATLMAKIAP